MCPNGNVLNRAENGHKNALNIFSLLLYIGNGWSVPRINTLTLRAILKRSSRPLSMWIVVVVTLHVFMRYTNVSLHQLSGNNSHRNHHNATPLTWRTRMCKHVLLNWMNVVVVFKDATPWIAKCVSALWSQLAFENGEKLLWPQCRLSHHFHRMTGQWLIV